MTDERGQIGDEGPMMLLATVCAAAVGVVVLWDVTAEIPAVALPTLAVDPAAVGPVAVLACAGGWYFAGRWGIGWPARWGPALATVLLAVRVWGGGITLPAVDFGAPDGAAYGGTLGGIESTIEPSVPGVVAIVGTFLLATFAILHAPRR